MLTRIGGGDAGASSSSMETFGDLVFCALVVLVLFVLALAVEVSQRVRAALPILPTIDKSEIAELSQEELSELSAQLQEQKTTIAALQNKMQSQQTEISTRLAALSGEQRFTGAREPASVSIAYDYKKDRYFFIPSRDIEHADRRLSGESTLDYLRRKMRELADIAIATRRQRSYTFDDASAVYTAFSRYREVVPKPQGYEVQDSKVGINYHTKLCEYISGDVDSVPDSEAIVTNAILKVYEKACPPGDAMYPRARVVVDDDDKEQVILGGVILSARDLRDILISFEGRGAMLDLDGLEGAAPIWLTEEALTPAGYIGKVPKLP